LVGRLRKRAVWARTMELRACPQVFDSNEGAALMWQSSIYEQWHSRRLCAASASSVADLVALGRAEGIRFLVLAPTSPRF